MKTKKTDGSGGGPDGSGDAPQENIDKALKPYSDNLPYNRDRIIEETKFFLKHQVIARYEAGRRLILLREQEVGHLFAQVLKDHFSGLGRRTAYEYMLFSRKIAGLPKLRDFAEGNGNFKKCLALLETFDEKELSDLEAGDTVAGIKLDEVDKMTVREMKDKLRKEKHTQQNLNNIIAGQELELGELEKENETLRAGKLTPEDHMKAFLKADKHASQAILLIDSLDFEVLRDNMPFLAKVSALVSSLEILVHNADARLISIMEGE